MRPLTVSIALLATIAIGDAHAGLVITMSQTVDGAVPSTQTIYLDAGRVRIPTPDGYVIYRGVSENTVIANIDEREYSVITSQQKEYSEKNVQIFDQEEANGSLEIEAYIHHAFLSYAKAGPVRAVGRWSCAPYKMLVGFQPRAELCISKLSDLGLTTEELQDLYRLERVLGQIMFSVNASIPPWTGFTSARSGSRSAMTAFPFRLSTWPRLEPSTSKSPWFRSGAPSWRTASFRRPLVIV